MRKNLNIKYFKFEEDFIEDNLRCIPMIVRMQLDRVGLKLSLKSWSRFSEEERFSLATSPCTTKEELENYGKTLEEMVASYSKENLALLDKTENMLWENAEQVPDLLLEKSAEFNQQISTNQWSSLSPLQRFALVKLSRPGHENRNFPKALLEFGLSRNEI